MTDGKEKEEEPVYINMIAGGISGAASKTCVAPLARLTILYQVQSFNKGIHSHPPDLSTQALPVRTTLPSIPSSSFPSLPSSTPISTSGSSRKGQRARTAHPRATPHPYLCRPPPPPHPPSLTHAMCNLVATEGVAALWRGNLATIIHRLPYSATNFAVFEAANKGLAPHMHSDIGRRLTAGAASGLVACIVAYPLDLVRTRLSAQRGGAAHNLHQTPALPPGAYSLPVRQGGGAGSSSSSNSSNSSSSSDRGTGAKLSSTATSTNACSSSDRGKDVRMRSTAGSTNAWSTSSSSSSSTRLDVAQSQPSAPSPSSSVNLSRNLQQRQQARFPPHITLYPPNTQTLHVAHPCHASNAYPLAPQQPLQQAQLLHQTAHLGPPTPASHHLPYPSQPPLHFATSKHPCPHTPQHPLQQQQQQHWQHQHIRHLPWQAQIYQHCLQQHSHWQQRLHTSSHSCSPTNYLHRLHPTTPRPLSSANPAVLHTRSSSTAHLFSPPMHTNITASATNGAAMSTASAIPNPHVTAEAPTPHYRGIVHALSHIVQQEGVLGLYRGLGATLLQVTPSLALNFALYDSFKDLWLKHTATHSSEEGTWMKQFTPWGFLDSSSSSSSINRNSVSAGTSSSSSSSSSSSCSSVSGGSCSSASNSSSRTSDVNASQSPSSSCDDTDAKNPNSSGSDSATRAPHMTTGSSMACGAAAGFFTSTLTFPLDVIRRRVQVSHRNSAGPHPSATSEYLAVWRQVYMANGLRGFYAGIMTEYAKVLPGMAIAFTVYEGTKELLKTVVKE